ncbi:2997_t:CDS:2, partial [Cetraspora pellucida]
DNVFTRIKKKIQETFDLEELKEDERMIIRYNEIKTGIEEETKIN